MTDEIIDRLHADVFAILRKVPSLATTTILKDDEGDIASEVERRLQNLIDPNGKIGLAVIVFAPEVVSAEKNLPGPMMKLQLEIQVIEQVLMNRDLTKGTRISAAKAALRVIGALHRQSLGDVILYAEKDPAKKVKVKKGYVSYLVTMNVFEIGLDPAMKPLGVEVAVVSGKYVLSCGTAGAAVWYTTDGSFPIAGGAGSTGYTVPITLPAGTVVRTAAFKAGMNPGDVLEFTATP